MSAKDIQVAPIASKDAHAFVRAHHYSGKSVQNSQLHLGAFIGRRLIGVAQFGPPMDRSKLIGLVRDTPWNSMLELNRLALVDDTPKNSESRFLSVCLRLIRKNAPHIQWIVSFADATQCGDGTIYRAAGFVLTGIKKNTQIWEAPDHSVLASANSMPGPNGATAIKAKFGIPRDIDGRRGARFSRIALTDNRSAGEKRRADVVSRTTMTKANNIGPTGAASMKHYEAVGFRPLPGFQLRYIYFLEPSVRERLTVPVLPFTRIAEMGAGMYLGKPRAGSIGGDAPADQAGEGGSIPTPALHSQAGLARW